MEDFIQTATTQLEVSEQASRRAAQFILQFVKSQLGESDFEQLIEKLPGAGELLSQSDGTDGQLVLLPSLARGFVHVQVGPRRQKVRG